MAGNLRKPFISDSLPTITLIKKLSLNVILMFFEIYFEVSSYSCVVYETGNAWVT